MGRTRTGEPVGVINLMGRVFMTALDDPFAVALREIDAIRAKTRVIFVDFHAEATSEKIAMGWHLDGRVTAVVGTHTHVQTADDRILPKGTACLTDAGMTGPHDSIIGVTVDAALGRFLNAMPAKFEAASGPGRLNAVIVTADPKTGRAVHRAAESVRRCSCRRQPRIEALAAARIFSASRTPSGMRRRCRESRRDLAGGIRVVDLIGPSINPCPISSPSPSKRNPRRTPRRGNAAS